MLPVTITLSDTTVGDTWEGISIGPILFNGTALGVNLASCFLYFKDKYGRTVYGFNSIQTTGFGLATINSATTWTITIPSCVLPLGSGKYNWGFKTIDANGIVRTLYKGILTIV